MFSSENQIRIELSQPPAHTAGPEDTVAAKAAAIWTRIVTNFGPDKTHLLQLNASEDGLAQLTVTAGSETTRDDIRSFLEEQQIPGLSFPAEITEQENSIESSQPAQE